MKARQEKGLSQKKLEALCGVKQPIIARIEKGSTIPQLDTILKILAPLGKTLQSYRSTKRNKDKKARL